MQLIDRSKECKKFESDLRTLQMVTEAAGQQISAACSSASDATARFLWGGRHGQQRGLLQVAASPRHLLCLQGKHEVSQLQVHQLLQSADMAVLQHSDIQLKPQKVQSCHECCMMCSIVPEVRKVVLGACLAPAMLRDKVAVAQVVCCFATTQQIFHCYACLKCCVPSGGG